jgi:broad specificity phosphatase PhoE
MTILYLIRHGRTDWNDVGRYQGQSEAPLNALGRQQARELAAALRDVPWTALYSSDLARARQTAQALSDLAGLPVRLDVRLREIDVGRWSGQLFSDVRAADPELYARWRTEPAEVRPPGGESLQELAARMAGALDDIAAAHPDGTVAVFGHGAAIATVRCFLAGRPLNEFWELLPHNATWEVVSWPAKR